MEMYALFQIAVIILTIVAMWRVFRKANQPGWASLIPIYNFYVLLKIGGKPGWWLILMFIPIVNIFIVIATMIGVANRFGKGMGFGLGLTFLAPVFFPLLAFRD